jgi:hypothetical protein
LLYPFIKYGGFMFRKNFNQSVGILQSFAHLSLLRKYAEMNVRKTPACFLGGRLGRPETLIITQGAGRELQMQRGVQGLPMKSGAECSPAYRTP